MNTDQIASIVRTVLKIVSGILLAHGLGDTASIINTPDVVGLVVLLVSAIWSHFSHASPPDATGGSSKAGGVGLLVSLGVASLLLTGCAGSLNKKAFDAEMTAATTAHVAMTSYGVYWDKAYANPTAFNRTPAALVTEREKVSAVSVKIGTGIEIVEGFRQSYATNSAIKPQLTAAITALSDNTGQLVPFVLSFINIQTNQPTK